MAYRYTGDAHDRLVAAYQADDEPFPTTTDLAFPERTHGRNELLFLERLFFPRCWNAGSLVDDQTAVRETLASFGNCCFVGSRPYASVDDSAVASMVDDVLAQLPAIRQQLQNDVEAAYKGDPAAESYLQVIRSYPGFHAIMVQRVAHAFYEAGATEYARELTEYAKTITGIDIHPGAEIGSYFFIDHGTSVVIGETTTVGDWVRLYQDVTLGALHFEEAEDDDKMLKKDYKRHPDIGNNVVIGAGTKVLGPISIGDHVSIGANSWITEDIPPHTTVFVAEHPTQERKRQADNR